MAGNWNDYRLDEASFLNLHGQRAPRIMWLLGAGASVGAGLPTAYTLTWDLKRTLYCNTHKIPPARFPDLNDRDFQALVQSFLSERRGYPPAGCDEEYSAYFERVYPDEGDRRRYLESRLQGARPSYGHFCLAALVALGRVQIIWTTNFDPLIEEAIVQVQRDRLGQSKLAVVSLECPDKLVDCLRDERWPVLVKLHGDYQYRALKNVKSELEEQDKTLRRRLVDQGGRRGLAVVGYSGRDVSVMQALEEVVDGSLDAFPHGLFWFTRPGALPGPRVLDLLSRIRGRGSQAALIETGGFDELMADLFLPHHEAMPEVRDLVKAKRERRRPIGLSHSGQGWPCVRTNALEITAYPSTCTLFRAEIGGAKEVRALAAPHASRIVAGRRRGGIVAVGTRQELAEVFREHKPSGFDRHPILAKRLRYQDTVEMGLLYGALCQAISTATGLARSANYKGRRLFIGSPDLLDAGELAALRLLNIRPTRPFAPANCTIHEAVHVGIEYQDDRLWLLLEPTLMVTTDGQSPYLGDDRSKVGREDLVRRYNKVANDLLDFWVRFLVARCGRPIRLAFPEAATPEAEFVIGTVRAFSRGS